MKLSHARGATQDGQVMVERSDRRCPTGEVKAQHEGALPPPCTERQEVVTIWGAEVPVSKLGGLTGRLSRLPGQNGVLNLGFSSRDICSSLNRL